ncbi:MAG: hypothetical protein QNL04_15285 [SAR324 cluster bacterium]|nr:hypothetical protein [SAR324 cluster bacterium]
MSKFNPQKIEIHLSEKAQKQLTKEPVLVHLELLFSCLLRKRVYFYSGEAQMDASYSKPLPQNLEFHRLSQNLSFAFQAVMTKACSVSDTVGEPEVVDFPTTKLEELTPQWLWVDYTKKGWTGDFGFRLRELPSKRAAAKALHYA